MRTTKALLNGYGFDVATVTNEEAAHAAVRAVHYDACIICAHSFSPHEREQIAAMLRHSDHETSVVFNCPGCRECDEMAGRPGCMPDAQWLSGIVSLTSAGGAV